MKDNLKKITMSCRKVFIRHLPIIHSFYKSGSSRLETCRDDNFLSNSAVRGFTLIELLVVVLIIGILASVALPQYQKAVLKARYATLKPLAKALYEAEQLYYLANNTYTMYFSELDLEVASSDTRNTSRTQYFGKNSYCSLDATYLSCRDMTHNMAYRLDYSGESACVAYDADKNSAGHQICKAETGRSGPSEGYSSTYFYP